MQTKMTEALATHILSTYEAMDKEAVEVDGSRLFIGSLSVLIRSIASATYYAPITRALYDGGYMALVDRGGRDKPSTVVLIRPPKKDELLLLTLEPEGPIISLLNRLEAIEKLTGGMNVVAALVELGRRLEAIEQRLEQSSGKTKK